MMKHSGYLCERRLARDEVSGAHLAARDSVQSLANEPRCMVKAGFDGDLRIMQRRGIDLHFRPARASTKKLDSAALADHRKRPLPGFRAAHRFDHGVSAAPAFG